MDFRKVIPIIIGEFDKAKINYALIGGFAMGALGMVRSTVDLDFLIDSRDLEKSAGIMKKYGYRCVHKTENVSQYVSNVNIFGEMDFLHAFRPVSMDMLKHARAVPVLEKRHTVKVVRPEDIIGLKVQAAANDRTREAKENADIESIMQYYRNKLDWRLLKEYFELFGWGKQFKALKGQYGKTQQRG